MLRSISTTTYYWLHYLYIIHKDNVIVSVYLSTMLLYLLETFKLHHHHILTIPVTNSEFPPYLLIIIDHEIVYIYTTRWHTLLFNLHTSVLILKSCLFYNMSSLFWNIFKIMTYLFNIFEIILCCCCTVRSIKHVSGNCIN